MTAVINMHTTISTVHMAAGKLSKMCDVQMQNNTNIYKLVGWFMV